jgi:hypothetical protein
VVEEDASAVRKLGVEACGRLGQEPLDDLLHDEALSELASRMQPVEADAPGEGPGEADGGTENAAEGQPRRRGRKAEKGSGRMGSDGHTADIGSTKPMLEIVTCGRDER